MKIGFLGTGLLGSPMVEKLLENNFETTIYNRTTEKLQPLVKLGAKQGSSFGDVINNSDIIFVVLADYNAVNLVLFDENVCLNGKTIIQMSTIAPEENVALSEETVKAGGKFLEAPVLGSIPQIKAKELIVIAGGDEKLLVELKPVLNSFTGKYVFAGNIGSASAIKLSLNHLIASLTASFSLSLGYLREQNVNHEIFMDILRASAVYAPTFDKKLGKMLNRDFNNPNFPLKHMLKDVNLMLDAFGKVNLDTAQLEGVQHIIKSGLNMGLENLDYSSLYNAVHLENK